LLASLSTAKVRKKENQKDKSTVLVFGDRGVQKTAQDSHNSL
jgi:hypothetical protein